MKKKTMAIIGGIVCVVLIAAAAACWLTDYSVALKANWGFSLPLRAGCTEIYAADTGPSFHGDGTRYHVFSYKREDPIASMLAWTEEGGATLYHASCREAAEEWLDELDIPAELRPDFENCVYWHDIRSGNCEIIVFWNKTEEILATLEFLM